MYRHRYFLYVYCYFNLKFYNIYVLFSIINLSKSNSANFPFLSNISIKINAEVNNKYSNILVYEAQNHYIQKIAY